MKKIRNLLQSKLIFSSPLLLTCAAGLLVIIVVTFAFHNYRLEKRLMTNAMLQKASILMRALDSGTRASYIADIKRNFWDSDPWQEHAQRVIDHLIDDTTIKEIGLIDSQGVIIAHNKKENLGKKRIKPLKVFEKGGSKKKVNKFYYEIISLPEYGKVLEAIKEFRPRFPTQPQTMMNGFNAQRENFFIERKGGRHPKRGGMLSTQAIGERHFLLIGLDMKEYDKTIRRLRVQIVLLSLVMLLIGIAGWFSLSVIQGYRVSQKTLDEVQAFTSLLVGSLPTGVIATNKFGLIATWNNTVTKITGINKEHASGKKPEEILPEYLSVLLATADSANLKEEQVEVIAQFNGRDYVLLCQVINIIDNQLHFIGKMLLLSDITEVKQLEQKMRESEKLAAIGKLAGGVAHEVRNPLSSIKGLALLLKNKFPGGSEEQKTAELLIQETERMNRAISEMLSLTRASSTQLLPVDISPVLNEQLTLLQAEINERNIEVYLDIEQNLKPVLGDRDRLVQVIINILLNSIQAMENGGSLTLEARNKTPEMIEIILRDSGIGMSDAILEQVFDPYFTTKKEGSGIGLAISHKIVTDHGGTITINSEQDVGTVVTVKIPAVS